MTLKEFAKSIDGYNLMTWHDEIGRPQRAKELGIVICYIDDQYNTWFKGAINTMGWASENAEFEFKKDGYFYSEEELYHILRHNPRYKYNYIQVIFEDAETKATWAFETSIPHQAFRIFKGNDLHCLGIVFYQKDLV